MQSKETFRGRSAVARKVKHLSLEIKKGNAVRKVFQPVFPFATERARFGILKSGFSAPSISNGLQERKVALRWDKLLTKKQSLGSSLRQRPQVCAEDGPFLTRGNPSAKEMLQSERRRGEPVEKEQGGKLPLEREFALPAQVPTRFPPPPLGSSILGKR